MCFVINNILSQKNEGLFHGNYPPHTHTLSVPGLQVEFGGSFSIALVLGLVFLIIMCYS